MNIFNIKVSLLRQLSIWSNIQLNKISKGECIAFKNTIVYTNKEAQIYVEKGSFMLNAKWGKKDPGTTVFSIGKGAVLSVSDTFRIHTDARIIIYDNASLKLGSGFINNRLNLVCSNSVSIGNNVVISENVTIRDTDDHQITSHKHEMTAPIAIGDHVWIGLNVTILKGVKIGNGAIIGAGSVVTKDVPENTLAVGVPAKVIRHGVEWQ